jgi:hypothetical protein
MPSSGVTKDQGEQQAEQKACVTRWCVEAMSGIWIGDRQKKANEPTSRRGKQRNKGG